MLIVRPPYSGSVAQIMSQHLYKIGPLPMEQVEDEPERMLGPLHESYRKTTDESRLTIPRKGEITFVPKIPGIECNATAVETCRKIMLMNTEGRFLMKAQNKTIKTIITSNSRLRRRLSGYSFCALRRFGAMPRNARAQPYVSQDGGIYPDNIVSEYNTPTGAEIIAYSQLHPGSVNVIGLQMPCFRQSQSAGINRH